MHSKSEEIENLKNLKDNSNEDLNEQEVNTKRTNLENGKSETSLNTNKSEVKSDAKSNSKRISLLIRLIGYLHILIIAILFCFSIYFYNEFITFKRTEEIDKESAVRITKSIGCIVVGLLIAYSRALLLEKY